MRKHYFSRFQARKHATIEYCVMAFVIRESGMD